MPEGTALAEMRQVLDEVFQDREQAAVREVYACASEKVRLPADVLAHLNEVPEGAYTREEFVEAVNEVIRRRGEQDTLGLLDES